MDIFEGVAQVPPDFGPSAVTVGKFDGVHAGHRAVLDALEEVAADEGLISAVVTFDRNPLSLLAPDRCPAALVSNAQKLELLDAAGVGATLQLAFDRPFSEQEPEQFVTSVLVNALRAEVVFVGADFRFGVRGSGDVELLRNLGRAQNFEVRQIPELHGGLARGRRISSTMIRELLDAGDPRGAAAALGRMHSIRSTVTHGEQRGRELGYPTANLSADGLEGFIPRDGVYATWATVNGSRFGAAVSIGNNPTFEGVPQKQVEAHLIDQSLDLYGQSIQLEFVEYIRPMNKFPSADALAAQMHEDEKRIRRVLELPVA